MLGVYERVNLQMPDRGLFLTEENIRKVVNVIRKYRPVLIFAPYHQDRHPDHGNCARLVDEAFFSSGIGKFQVEGDYPPHKARNVYYYMINGFSTPNFVVDISNFIEQKKASLQAYESQFVASATSTQTPLTNGYIDSVVARESLFGKEAGVAFAEGFISNRPLLVNNDIYGESI